MCVCLRENEKKKHRKGGQTQVPKRGERRERERVGREKEGGREGEREGERERKGERKRERERGREGGREEEREGEREKYIYFISNRYMVCYRRWELRTHRE